MIEQFRVTQKCLKLLDALINVPDISKIGVQGF